MTVRSGTSTLSATVAPRELAFGTVDAGANATLSVTVANDGDAPLRIDGTAVVGANASQFRVTAGGGGGVLAPGERRTVNVTFRPEGDGARNATLSVRSNDTDAPNATVALRGVGDAAPPVAIGGGGGGGGGGAGGAPPGGGSPPGDGDGTSVCVCEKGANLTIEVENAGAGEPVHVDLDGTSVAEAGADVRLTGLTVTTAEDADFELRISSGRGDAAPVPGEGAAFRYLRIEHDISDAAISGVRFDFEVKTSRLEAAGVAPGNVTLYRYSGGEWTDVGAVERGETAGYVQYRADSPGLSAFVIGEAGLADATTTTATTTTTTTTTTTDEPPQQAGGFDLWPVLLVLLLLGIGSGGYYAWRGGHLDAYLGDLNGPGGRD